MIKFEREIKQENFHKTRDTLDSTQASFNSDGCLVLRNYDYENKTKDEIIILSQEETNAIARLFRKIIK